MQTIKITIRQVKSLLNELIGIVAQLNFLSQQLSELEEEIDNKHV